MNEELIQSLNAYTTALEQRLSALEQRMTQLESRLSANSQTDQSVTNVLEQMQHGIRQLQANHFAIVKRFEIMQHLSEQMMAEEYKIHDGEAEATEEEVQTVPVPPSVEEEETPAPHPQVPQEEPQATAEPKHEAKSVPTQTSLFGAAVQDIRQAISLGDRFLFQRELFEGNGEKMQKTLDELNALDTLDEALAYVREHFDWDKDTHAAQLFETVLRRRF